jgi:hypothetical protein
MRRTMNDSDQPTSAPAGWYPDGEQAGHVRYWDGGAWTEYRVPAPTPSKKPHPHPAFIAAMIAAVFGAVLMMAVFPFVSGDPDEGGVKEVPAWTSGVSDVGIGMFVLAALLVLVGLVFNGRSR